MDNLEMKLKKEETRIKKQAKETSLRKEIQ